MLKKSKKFVIKEGKFRAYYKQINDCKRILIAKS